MVTSLRSEREQAMAAPIPPPPSDEEGLRLHQALSAGVPTATLDFFRAYFPHLEGWLAVRFPKVSPDLREQAVVALLHDVLTSPGQFDDARSQSLAKYLRNAARCDLLNLLAKQKRRRHESLDERVELAPSGGNSRQGVLLLLCDAEDHAEREALLQGLRESLDTTERVVMDLLLAGERATPRFAEAMGLGHLPKDRQEAEVKRVKDRIKLRIKRLGSR